MLKSFGKLLFKPSTYFVQGKQTTTPLVRSLQVVSNFGVDYSVGRLGHGDFHRKLYSLASSAGGLSGSVFQKGNKMHQTKIGHFFKKSAGGETPVKKKDDEDEKEEKKTKREVKEEVVEAKTTMKGRKRKSARSSSSEPEAEDEDSKKRKKNGLKVKLSLTKKPRRRIVVASDSEEEVEKKDTKKVKKDEEMEESEKSDEEESVKKRGKEKKKSESPKEKKSKKKAIEEGEEELSEKSEEEVEETLEKKGKRNGNKSESPKEEKSKKKASEKEEVSDKSDEKEKSLQKRGKGKQNGKKSESPKEEKSKKVLKDEKKDKKSKKRENEEEEDLSEKSDEEDADEKPVKKQEKGKKSESPNDKKSTKKVDKKERSSSPEKEKTSPKKEVKQEESPSKKTIMMGGGANPKGWNAEYDPSKAKYDPIADATWKRGEKVPYLALAKTLEVIEATSSRLKFIEILANYFRSVIVLSPDDLRFSVYLCLNKLAPAYEGIELGVAETNVMKAIAQATGRALDKIKADAGQLGDLGLVAESSRSNQKTLFQPQPLTVSGVFHKLKEIAAMTGQASHGKKISMITSMLVACKHSEARYLTRSLLGKLRIGLAEQSLLQALAQATYLTPPDQDMSEWPPKILNAGKKMSADSMKTAIEEHAFILKSSFCECPNYDILVKAMLDVGIGGLKERCKLTPGIPPRPMLAQPTKGVADVLQRFEGIRFTCEYKYDGERAQIHLSDDGVINIYSRNQENNTSKYPDIISRFSQCIKGDIKSCIIDAEAVAWDLEKGGILPFQVLSTRKRKDANESEIKVQVCIFAFDLIYLNGESLVKEPLFKRRELLRENFQVVEGQFLFATSVDTDSMEEVQEFLEESLKGNCEGLMVKTLDERATYELAKRSQKWLKLKKDYLDSGGDSLDLVVIGGFLGKGKRTGTYGGFLLACYDPDEEAFQTICKIGTGFSDEQLQQHSDSLKPNIIPSAKSYYRFHNQLTPDHWFDAVQVWEVKCADLSLSPVHKAGEGIADPERGISLRFPRFLRVREDKNVEDATSSRQVADMYNNQEQVKNMNGNGKGGADEDEFY